MMNNHMPIMDTLNPHVVSSRKRIRTNDSSDNESQHDSDEEEEYFPDWNMVWPRFIVLTPYNETELLTKLSPFAVEKNHQREIWNSPQGDQNAIGFSFD